MKDIPICSQCKVKTEYASDSDEYVCPMCAAVYYPSKEIVEYEDDFTSSHEDEQPEIHGTGGGTGLTTSDEDISITEMLHKDPRLKPNMGEGVYFD